MTKEVYSLDLKAELFAIERKLGEGDGDTYREHLVDEAVVIVPGQALGKDETIAAMDASPGWDETSFDDERLVPLADDCDRITGPAGG